MRVDDWLCCCCLLLRCPPWPRIVCRRFRQRSRRPSSGRHAEAFRANRKQDVFGPFVPLLRSPEVMLRAMAMGDFLRYRTVFPTKLNELIILITRGISRSSTSGTCTIRSR